MKRSTILKIAGAFAIIVAIVHGLAAEARLFPTVTAEKPAHLLLLRFVWQASTLAWISFGTLLMLAPGLGNKTARAIVVAALVNFGAAAVGGLIAMGPTHYGWMLLTILSGLIAYGLPPEVETAVSS
jgi:hypothetical protein